MKSKLLILLSLLIIITLAVIGCNNKVNKSKHIVFQEAEEKEPILAKQTAIDLETYIPIMKDTVWEYKSDTYKKDSKIWIDFIKDNTFQLRIQNGLESVAKVYVKEQGAIYEVATIEDTWIKRDYTNFRQYKYAILKLPLEKGENWYVEENITKTITGIDVPIQTENGEVKAIEVMTRGADFTQKDYYGEKIGLVKTIYRDSNGKKEYDLVSVKTSEPIEEEIKVYFGDMRTSKLAYTSIKIPIRTNEEPKHFLTDVLKKIPDEEYVLAIPKSAIIESIYLDEETQKLYLDMSKEYYDMNYGRSKESLAIQSLVTTVGNYYHVNEVILTVAGEAYRTDNISFRVGESISVTNKNINKIAR